MARLLRSGWEIPGQAGLIGFATQLWGESVIFVSEMKTFLKILTLFVAAGAFGGAVMMWMDPTGVSWGGEPMLDLLRAKMPWPDIFFKDFTPSGYVLLAVNGLPQLLAAILLFKNHRLAYWACLACGILLMLWIALEWYIWGFVALSNIFFVLGAVETVCAAVCLKRAR